MSHVGATDEDRAERLFREGISFIVHDHDVLRADIERFRRSGVTAKQVHISCDGQIYAEQEAFWSSATPEQLVKERNRVGASTTDLPKLVDTTATGLFLRSALIAIEHLRAQIDASRGGLVLALEADDIVAAKRTGSAALLLGSEGSRLIQSDLGVLRSLYRLGLRHLQLSWAWETSVGTPQSDTTGRGITDFGRDLIRELNDLGAIVDVAHLSYASIAEVVEVSRVPVLCSHTGSLTLNPEQTVCLPDDLIRKIGDTNGVVAVHFMSQIVKPGRHKATFAELMAQITHIARLIGAEHVGLAPDYGPLDPRMWKNYGITIPYSFADGVEDVGKMPNMTRGLVAAGFDDDEIRGIMGENILRLFRDVRAARRPIADLENSVLGFRTAGTTPL
jgi:membrane dipeptidase